MKFRVTDDQAQAHYIREKLEANDGYCPGVVDSNGQAAWKCPCTEFVASAKKGEICKCEYLKRVK